MCIIMTIEIFVLSPGDGREFIYSPVNRNATILCAVSEEVMEWTVDGLNFYSSTEALVLLFRRIFKSTTEISPNGVATSNVTVFGDVHVNNNTQVCCQTIVNSEVASNCTTLIIYGEHIINYCALYYYYYY